MTTSRKTESDDAKFPDRVVEAIGRGEYESHPDGTLTVCGHRFDHHGNPMHKSEGCPNCGKGKGWVDTFTWCAAENAGHDLDGPCSRACAMQLEHAAAVAGERITREAVHGV